MTPRFPRAAHPLLATGATALVALALAATAPSRAAQPAAPPLTRVEYEGTLYYEAHFRRPGEVRPYHSRQVFVTNGRGDVRLDMTTWKDGDSVLSPETFLIVGDQVFHRDSPDRPWGRTAGVRVHANRFQATAGLPAELERVMRREHDTHAEWHVAGGRLERYTRLWPHPRLGDVRDSASFTYAAGDPVPRSLAMTLYERDANWRITATRVASSTAAQPESLFQAPATFEPNEVSYEDDSVGTVPPLTPIAAGIWSIDFTDANSRTLVVEFSDHVAVIEMAVGSNNGERIVAAVRHQWPGKPIRYALFSHYHPHYTGGLRPMIAEGATVVTTPGNEAFVRRVAAYPFKTWPDRLAKHPRPVKVTTFTGRTELADAANRLVAFDYGERSQHTDEFVVFWFPLQNLMFEAEQGWSGSNATLRAGRRAKALLAWAGEQGLDVERVVQSWPMRGDAATLSRAELDSLVNVKR